MKLLGVDLEHAKVVTGRDETGHPFTRTFATLELAIHPVGAASLRQERPRAMFQSIIHEGLIGHAFLRHWTVTFDVRSARVIFGPSRRL